MRNKYNVIFTVICVSISFLNILPVMSAYSGGVESCTLVIHGYNLLEFSALGCVPMLAPLLIPVILFDHQSKATQEVELMLLLLANMTCYVHSFNAAKAWLTATGVSMISYHPGALLIPLGFILLLALVTGFDMLYSNTVAKGEKEKHDVTRT